MFMGPIVAAETPARIGIRTPVRTPARPPASPLARFATGVPVLMLAVLVMVPWLLANAVVGAIVLGLRALPGAPRALLAAIDYAGSIALGR